MLVPHICKIHSLANLDYTLGCPDLRTIQPCELLFGTVMYCYHMDQYEKKKKKDIRFNIFAVTMGRQCDRQNLKSQNIQTFFLIKLIYFTKRNISLWFSSKCGWKMSSWTQILLPKTDLKKVSWDFPYCNSHCFTKVWCGASKLSL